MHKVTINNEFVRFNYINENVLVKPDIKCDHKKLIDIFIDLFCEQGFYEINYEYDGKKIYIINGYYKPEHIKSIKITKEYINKAIANMTKWDYKNRICNMIE